MENYEDKIYSLGETVMGQTQTMSQAVQKTLENNGGVGIMTGSYLKQIVYICRIRNRKSMKNIVAHHHHYYPEE